MQVSEMAAIHLLRSQTPLLNSSKFKLLRPTLNSLIIYTQHDQNPIFSRQVHSITPTSSPESPLIDVNDASQEPFYESSPRGWSTFSNPPFKSTNSIKSVGSNGEEGSRNPSSLIDVNGASAEPFDESSPSGWSTFSTVPFKPTNSVKSVGSNEEEGSRNPVHLSSNVAERKVYWVCSACEETTAQWRNTCKSCNSFGTLNKSSGSENETSKNMTKSSMLPEEMVGRNAPVRLMDVNRGINHTEWRIRLDGLLGSEVNTVLGGGVVPGSLILVGGDPGVGKSTFALQMAALIAVSCDVGGAAPVLYISGEESVEQIGNRAHRLGINTEDLFLYSSTDVKDILEKVRALSPRAVVIDSIQTVYLEKVIGSAGGLSQVKECTSALLRFAKKTNIPILLIGHVNKSGEIAGPRVLEHTVDVVLYMEGERHSSHRLLRTVKNRFGSTDELGVFKMSESGLEAVSNSSEMFLSEEQCSEYVAGHAITVIIDGSRSFLVEIQALCVSGTGSTRHVNGVNHSRADMILSVLKKQVGLKLDDHSIYLNILSGVFMTETSGDLAMAVAICSSFLEFSLPKQVAFIGEIGLGGELRMVPRIEKRVITLAKLGYKKCVVPESARKALGAVSSDIQIVCCKNLNEVIDEVFRRLD